MFTCSAEKYAFLYDKENREELLMKGVGNQRVKTVRAGELLYIASFPIWNTRAQAEQAKNAPRNAEAVRRVNVRNRKTRFEQIVHANFGRDDYYFTATYTESPQGNRRLDEEYYRDEPQDEIEAQRNVRKFIRALRALVKRKGGDVKKLKYLYVTEETYTRHPDPAYDRARYHHHMLITREVGQDGAGNEITLTRDEIERLWQDMPFASGRVRCDRLQPDKNSGLSAVAQYLVKQEKGETLITEKGARKNQHRYAGSKNLKKPEPTVADHKISKRRVQRLATDVRANAKDIFESLYPDYRLCEEPTVRTSDYVEGAYIYAKMIRKEGEKNERKKERAGQADHGAAGAD